MTMLLPREASMHDIVHHEMQTDGPGAQKCFAAVIFSISSVKYTLQLSLVPQC